MYIRTKNRIYQVESILRDNGFVKGYNVGEMAFIRKDQVINQSENLEELCDCFVTKGNKHIVWDKQHNKGIMFEQVKDSYPSYHFEIYGAIWTDKGLIYVAKMNESVDLELI